METIILTPDKFNINNVKFSEPKILPNGGKAIYLNYETNGNKQIIVFQTPKMMCPYGISCFDGEYRKYSLEMSFGGMEDDTTLEKFYQNIEAIDNKLISEGINNSQAWFKKKKISEEVVTALYAPGIKVSRDKDTGEPNNKYPPTFKVKVPFKDEKFTCNVYDNKKTKIEDNICDLLGKGCRVQCLIQCVGLWFAGGKYGCSWKIVQVKVNPSKSITGYSFVDDSDDDDDGSNKVKSSEDGSDDDDDDVVAEDSDLEDEAVEGM